MNNSDEFLDKFVEEMRSVMRQHDEEKGCSWKEEADHILVDNLFEEIHEFEIKDDPTRELIDIANSCYILWAKRKMVDYGATRKETL